MAQVPITPFPCLRSETSTSLELSEQTPTLHTTAYSAFALPSELVVLSWAHLLRAYTGHDHVCFVSDEGRTTVYTDSFHIVREDIALTDTSHSVSTGLSFASPTSHGPPSLWLHHDLHTGDGVFVSACLLPTDHLSQLGLQLQSILVETANKHLKENRLPPIQELQLSILNPSPKRLDCPPHLHRILDPHVSSPEPALVHLDKEGNKSEYSYQFLLQCVRKLASRLRRVITRLAPHSEQVIIPILAPQAPELYIGQLAILYAGAAFCPLALDAPDQRIKFVCEDTSAPFLLTTSSLASKSSLLNRNIILIDDSEDADGSDESTSDPPSKQGLLSYVMYTSGSTGQPKGVLVSHAAVLQSLKAHEAVVPHFYKFLQFAAPTFDVAIFEIYFTLMRGATIVSCDRATLLRDLPATIKRLQVDAAELTPTVAGTLLRHKSACPSLKLLLTIGEMLTRSVIDEFGATDKHPGLLHATYGPTEAAVHCTIQPTLPSSSITGNIGSPLVTVSAFIIDPDPCRIKVLPVGYVGELAIGGHQLANGYLNRPEQTNSSFVQSTHFGRIYRTGDRARMLPNGTLDCLGRISDQQVKLRGQRIELGEIEQVAVRFAGTRYAMALVIDDQLVLFVIPVDEKSSPQSVLQTCREWLPLIMTPAKIHFLDELPRLPSAKVDKRQLEQLHRESSVENVENPAGPTNVSEEYVSDIVHHILSRRLSLNASFTQQGLDSLQAIRIASSLGGKGHRIGADDVLSAGSIQQLASIVQHLDAQEIDVSREASQHFLDLKSSLQKAVRSAPDVQQLVGEIEDIVCCSPIQLAMLAESNANRDAYYNIIELDFEADAEEVARVLQELGGAHSIIRSGFLPVPIPESPYAAIIWKDLAASQLSTVDHDNPAFALQKPQGFLRPLQMQIRSMQARCRVVFIIHHALYDGWSWDLLVDDMDRMLHQHPIPKRPLYDTYTASVYHYLHSSKLQESLSYWERSLQFVRAVPFPQLSPLRPRQRPTEKLMHKSRLNGNRLRTVCREFDVHPQTVFLAALSLILHSYTACVDIVIGTVSAGRTLPLAGIEDIIGPCISTLPLRITIDGFQSASELLRDIQQRTRDMLRHGNVPLSMIKKAAGMQPLTAIFDAMMVWQESTAKVNHTGPRSISQVSSIDFVEHKVLVEVEPLQSSLLLTATYKSEFVSRSEMDLLLRQLDDFCDVILSQNAKRSILEITRGLSDDHMSIANPIPTAPQLKPFYYHVEAWAESDPDRLALEFVEDAVDGRRNSFRLSYKELNNQANKLAGYLLGRGLQPNDVVCVVIDKSLELYIAELAIAKAGAAFLPIAPSMPTDRITAIFDESAAGICLVHEDTLAVAEKRERPVFVDVADSRIATADTANPNVAWAANNLAYVIFTSGTTGTPKGVAVTQGNIASNLTELSTVYPKPPHGSRYLQSCSQAFDVSVFDIFYTWFQGMCLVSTPTQILFRDIESFVSHYGITHLSMTPTIAAMINPSHVPKVQFLVTAGEMMTDNVLQQWAGPKLYNGSGPAETTNICTVQQCAKTDMRVSLVGRPLRNTSAFVAVPNENFSILPKGAVGELCFGGHQIFKGYLERDDLTRAKIVDHARFGRLYRSGDLGVMLADGSILCLGRVDNQVKIRGQRVELDDIDSVIMQHPDVGRCVTVASMGEDSKVEYLVAFRVTSGSPCQANSRITGPSEHILEVNSAIFELVLRKLPEYMCPRIIIPVSELPQTQNGKLDRKILQDVITNLNPQLTAAFSRASQGCNDGNGDIHGSEAIIRQVLSTIVQRPLDQISRSESFYSYGIDSITAIIFAGRLRDQLHDIIIDVPAILSHPSVRSLARFLQSQESDGRDMRGKPLVIEDVIEHDVRAQADAHFSFVEDVLPCTPLQQSMLSASTPAQQGIYYNTIHFELKTDAGRIRAAWERVIMRQPILRTRFMSTTLKDMPFVQVVLSHDDLPWEELSDPDDSLISDSAGQAIDVNAHPWRICLVRSASSDVVTLELHMHHALYDGIAINNLLREVEQTCKSELLRTPISFRPFLEQMLAANTDATDGYWAQHVADFEPTAFPGLTGRSKQSLESFTGYGEARRDVEVPLTSILKSCQKSSTTLLTVCQCVWAKMLHAYLGSTDVCFGNVMSCRNLPIDGVDRLIAPCFNTLPVRVKIQQEYTNHDLQEELKSINTNHLRYQLTALRRIQSRAGLDGQHLFDTLLIFQQPSTALDKSIWSVSREDGIMGFPLAIEIIPSPRNNSLTIALHYQRSVVSNEGASIITSTFMEGLRTCIEHPQSSALSVCNFNSELCASSPDCKPVVNHDEHELLQSAFESNARDRPRAPALEYLSDNGELDTWSFERLNDKANAIAQALRTFGIGREEAVIIHMSKSPFFYASVLGILKAGATFTPFDPSMPKDRKRFMEDELQARVILLSEGTVASWSRCLGIDVRFVSDNFSASIDTTIDSSSLAYRLYTSGSTGSPKAVSIEHRNAVQTVLESKRLLPWNKSSRLLQYASITFDMCYFDCFIAWSCGFCLCMASQPAMYNDLVGVINTLHVTMLDLTPSVATLVQPTQVPVVALLYCIGEALPQQLVRDWGSKCVNSYGPTEAAMCTTIFATNENIDSTIIGSPFSSTKFTVVGGKGFPAPVFGVGELYIASHQLARGYHANDKLTREQFVEYRGERSYRSGDKVRMLHGGLFQFIGRNDDQVKIRGLRVELDEVTCVVKASTDLITGATTQILKAATSAKSQLVTFVTLSSTEYDREPTEDRIIRVCKRKLPAYMVPTSIFIIDHVPLSAAGKVDKRALQKIVESQPIRAKSHANKGFALSSAERVVVEALSSLAGVEAQDVQLSTSIFQLGLDSISAIQIAHQLRKQRLLIEPSAIMREPTVSGIAAAAAKEAAVHETEESNTSQGFDLQSFQEQYMSQICGDLMIDRCTIASIRPCTPFQAGSIAQFLLSRGTSYFNQTSLKFKPETTYQEIEAALDVLLEKYEMLRTGFASIDDRVCPFVMLTYRSRSAQLPLVLDSSVDVERYGADTAMACISHLHLPTWGALAQQDSKGTALHLFIHHALYDAASLRMMMDDMNIILAGDSVQLPISNIDRTLSTIFSKARAEDEARIFWQSLQDQALINRFPDLTPLKASNSNQMTIEMVSSKPLRELEAGCKVTGTTLATVGQAAWARLLSAYTGEDLVTFGNVLSGRMNQAAYSAAFPCITTVPIMADCSKDDNTLLQNIMRHNSGVLEVQFTPLNKIQRWLGLGEDAPFDTLFAFQNQPHHHSERLFELIDTHAKVEYPLSIELEPTMDAKLAYRLTFQEERVPKAQAKILLAQLNEFVVHISELAGRPGQCLSRDLLSITPPKQPRIQSEVNLLHELVDVSACQNPQKLAFEFVTDIREGQVSKQVWRYTEIVQEGNKVANFLLQQGTRQGALIALCFNKCPEASFAMLGILKAGCGFVAIDSEAPRARKAFIVQDSQATAILTTSDLSSSFGKDIDCLIHEMDLVDSNLFSAETPTLTREVKATDTSYCLYTSGTTGTPKGCNLSHDNAVQAMMAFRTLFRWRDDARWLQFAGYHFDVSVLEHFWTWGAGLCLVGIPRDILFEDLSVNIGKLDISHIDLTPALAQIVDPKDVPRLCTDHSVFITGGEALRDDIIAKWGHFETIYNGYGPTEATIGCTMYPRVPYNGKSSNVGKQFENVGSLVLKPGTKEPVLRGAPGELCVYGPLVAKGYLNRPDKTAESFQELQVNGNTERVYRTGDLVRILHDGSFAFAGREDDQIKVRGQRIETREINAVILSGSRDVKDVVTLKLRHPKQQKEQLVSFLHCPQLNRSQLRPAHAVKDSKNIIKISRQLCQDHLPKFAVPTHLIPMTVFPLSANNKIDTKRLKVFFDDMSLKQLQGLVSVSKDDDGETGSLTDRETEIISILARYCGHDILDMSRTTTVFEVGLDSISILAFSRALREAGYVSAQPALIMKHPSFAKLSKALSHSPNSFEENGSVQAAKQEILATNHQFRGTAAKALKVKSSDIESVMPCTPLQQGMISRALSSDHPIYFVDFRLTLKSCIDMARLRKAWEDVVKEVPILRTCFVSTDHGHIQTVVKAPPTLWREAQCDQKQSLQHLLDEKYGEWWERNHIELRQPVEIIACRTASERILALHIFHALYDGTSLQLLLDAVTRAYNGRPIDPGPLFHEVLPYGPLCGISTAQDFWMKHLKGVQSFERISSLIHTSNTESNVVSHTMCLPPHFEECRRKLNTTHQALAQAGWTAALTDFCGGPVVLGMVVSGRQIGYQGADKTIGPLFNTIPFALPLSGSMNWATAVSYCHAFNTDALPYQHTALREITKWCMGAGILSTPTLFDTLFVFQKEQKPQFNLDDIWQSIDSGASATDYPMALELGLGEHNVLHATINAQAAVANEETLHKLLSNFEMALRAIVDGPQVAISETFQLPKTEDFCIASDISTSKSLRNGTNGHASRENQSTWSTASQRIRDAVSEMSGVAPQDISAEASILELGLDSVDAIKLSSMLRHDAGIVLSQKQIMQSLTITKMAQSSSAGADNEDMPAQKALDLSPWNIQLSENLVAQAHDLSDVEQVLPLTPLQEAMVAQMQASDFETYFNHDVLALRPDLDLERLQQAWQSVIDQNPILRTSFVQLETTAPHDSFAQLIHRAKPIQWISVAHDCDADFTHLLDNVRKHFLGTDGNTPLLCLTLVHSSRTGHATHLVLSIAHALYDGWSMAMIHHDVRMAYTGNRIQRPPFEPILAGIVAAADDTPSLDKCDRPIIKKNLTLLPLTDSPDLTNTYRAELTSAQTAEVIGHFCKSKNISVSALTQTAFALVLATLIPKTEVAFGVVLSGRDSNEAQEVMFPTMNTVVSRVILHGTRLDMVRYVQETMNELRSYDKYPMRKALSKVQSEKGVSRLFDAIFLFQRRPDIASTDGASSGLYRSVSGASSVEYPLAVEAEVHENALIWRNACQGNVFNEQQAHKVLDKLDELLLAILANSDAPCLSYGASGISICGLESFQQTTFNGNVRVIEDSTTRPSSERNRSQMLSTIRSVCAQVAQVSESDIPDDTTIFGLGLDSITAIKIQNILSRREVRLSVRDMLRAGTISGMASVAQHIETTDQKHTPFDLSDAKQATTEALADLNLDTILGSLQMDQEQVEAVLPATAGQVYMLAVHAISGIYQPSFEYTLTSMGNESKAAMLQHLARCWESLVAMTPILRTLFAATGNIITPFVQVVTKPHSSIMQSSIPGPADSTSTDSFRPIGVHTPFVQMLALDTSSDRVIRIKLHIHHALYDGVSLPLLIDGLEQLMRNPAVGLAPSSRDQTVTITALTASSCSSSTNKETHRFWSQYMRNAATPNPRPARSAGQGGPLGPKRVEIYNPCVLAAKDIARIKIVARNHNIPLQTLFLASYAKVYTQLNNTSADQDVVIGVYLANRTLPLPDVNLSELPAPTLNLLPVRIAIPTREGMSLIDVAKNIQGDIQHINEDARRATVSLADLYRITEGRVTVDTFVNFVSLPDSRRDEDSEIDRSYIIEEVDTGRSSEEYARVIDAPVAPGEDGTAGFAGLSEDVLKAYRPALDIEAAVTRAGELAMGVFCDEAILELDEAKGVVDNVVAELRKVVNGAA